MSSTMRYEKDCREIHDAWNQLSHLSLLLAPRNPSERQQIKETYCAMFGEDLVKCLHKIFVANEKNELCEALYMWMLDPAERDAKMAHDTIENRSIIDYRALVEIYTRRKQNQPFFTKQAYLVKFKKNLEQDIITEPSHPYQRLLVALATSHKSHHDDLSWHIAKCDAKRLFDAKNGSMRSVDEAVILEIFSKRSIPQLRLAFSSYKHIYGHDYTKALKKNGFGEFEDSLRVVVKCIYNPSKYYSKLLHTSMKCPATSKRLVTRAILGSDDAGMDNVMSVFKNSYGRKLVDAIQESLPESDYRDFLAAVTRSKRIHD